MTYRVLDLFSGIGGFSLGLERTGGFETVAFCEIEPFCQRVLAKHWPEVPCYDDVRTLTAERLRADGIAVDVICGGFPCQDISLAGKGAGLAGARSGLWSEIRRLACELRPDLIVLENVSALLGRGLGTVLGDLAAFGYDAEWHCIPASALGAPHQRDRWWLVAYPDCAQRGTKYSARQRVAWADALSQWQQGAGGLGASRSPVADASRSGRNEVPVKGLVASGQMPECDGQAGRACPDTDSPRLSISGTEPIGAYGLESRRVPSSGSWWAFEPDVGRVAHGVSSRVDRLRALGNAVVPQIPELIGRAILASEARR